MKKSSGYRLGALPIVLLLWFAPSLAQESEDPGQRASFQSARAVQVADARDLFPTLVIGGGTIVLEVKVDENGRINDIVPLRELGVLTDCARRWVRTWTWVPARVDGRSVASVATVAVTVDPSSYPRRSPPLPTLNRPPDKSQSQTGFLPPQVISAAFPNYPPTTILFGSVALDVKISDAGIPSDLKILRDVPPLTAAAIDSLRAWKFSPAFLENKPIAAQITLGFIYTTRLLDNSP